MDLFYILGFVLVLAVVMYFVKSKRSAGENSQPRQVSAKKTEPRDYLDDATGYLNPPKPLRELLVSDYAGTMRILLDILQKGGIYERKYAAYALGQIGDANTLTRLKAAFRAERVSGVKNAMAAAIGAIEQAPLQKGFGEEPRREIIRLVYDSSPCG